MEGSPRAGWGPFDQSEAQAISSWGANAVRVPLNEDCWLGINGAPNGFSAAAYRAAIVGWVRQLNQAGLIAILDLHWSAPGPVEALGQWPMPDASHSPAFWAAVASTFASDPAVIYDLFNEPFLGGSTPTMQDWACWRNGCSVNYQGVVYQAAGMQQLLDTVRAAGATQPVMAGGPNWANDLCTASGPGSTTSTCMWLHDELSDPDRQLIASFHTYNYNTCNNVACWNSTVLPVAQNVPVITGEFGEQNCSSTFDTTYMDWADTHGISYLAWAWVAPDNTHKTCTQQNLTLITNYTGTPNSPAGQTIQQHLLHDRDP